MTIIVYASKEKLTPDHHPVRYYKRDGHLNIGHQFYIRAQHVPVGLETALSQARPLPGENVVNTIPDVIMPPKPGRTDGPGA